jgi:two-component system sensor histidine kinase RegB
VVDVHAGLASSLRTLRWFAVAGQSATVLLVVYAAGLPLDASALWPAIFLLAVFNIWATRDAARAHEVTSGDIVAQLAVDVVVLAWLIAFTGGASNPFTSLFLLPVALVAIALPMQWVVGMALICAFAYGVSAAFGKPLPHIQSVFGTAFDLHLWGMAVNFVISVSVVAFFLTRLARSLRDREEDVARLREQFARNEGIVSLATHAASVAHELNTPLATLTLLVEEQLDKHDIGESADRDELHAMARLIDDCRDRVRELAAPATGETERLTVEETVNRIVERWRLLRPAISLSRSGSFCGASDRRLDPAIGHLLQALLNNAADASESVGISKVDLQIDVTHDELCGEVRDYGQGVASKAAEQMGALFNTTKTHGLGVGLALSHATIERLRGTLSMHEASGGGMAVRFEVPLHQESGEIDERLAG